MALPDYLEWAEMLLGPDAHAGRPAVTEVPVGALFVCTDDDVVEINTGSSWDEWFDPEAEQ